MNIKNQNGTELANFAVQLERLYQNPDAPASPTLELTVTQGVQSHSLFISYNRLDQLDIQQLVPGCVYLMPKAKTEVAKMIRLSVAQALQSETQIGTMYPQSGWYDQPSEKIFVAGGAIISGAGLSASEGVLISEDVAQLHLAADHALTSMESSERLIRALVSYGEYAIPVFAYTLYGVLHSVWSEANLPTACVLNLIGTQGFGKTTLARTFCALYDDSTGRIADFYDAQSTPASMREALSSARDRIVVVDDLCKSSSRREMQKRRDLTANLLRVAANESPISKMKGDAAASSVCSSGLVLTGELPLEVSSDVTRCVIIDVKRPLRNGNPDERIIAATAVENYIQWLCAHFSEEMDRLKHEYRLFDEADTTKHLWRLKKSLFQLDWAFNSFLRFSKNVGAISATAQQQFEKMSRNAAQKIFTYEETLVQKIEDSDPANWKRLILEGANKRAFPYKLKPDCLCIKLSDLTKFFRHVLHNPGLQEQEMVRKLKEQNLLLMDKSGKSTKKVSGVRMLNINILD